MAKQQPDDSRISQEVDHLLGQLKSQPYGTPRRSRPHIVATPRPVVGVGIAREHHPWRKMVLVASLGVGLVFWPYARGCGLGLTSYFAALGVLLLTAAWALQAAWREHTAWAYGLGLAVVVWGAGLSLVQVLPRVGYARHAAYWSCRAGMDPDPDPGPGAANGAPGTAEIQSSGQPDAHRVDLPPFF